MDNHTPDQRKKNMLAVRNKDSGKMLRQFSDIRILRLLVAKLLFFVTVSFGMDLNGRIEKKISKAIVISGFPKSSEIFKEI